MITVGVVRWFANPTAVMQGENLILVTATWDTIEDGHCEESRLCFAFTTDPKRWERGLWQAIGSVNICRTLQVGLDDGQFTTFSHHTVH